MGRETRVAIAVVAGVIILIVLAMSWFSGRETIVVDTPAERVEPLDPISAPVPADKSGGAAPVVPAQLAADADPALTAADGVSQQNAGSSSAPATGESPETIRIIVREPLTVDGVDVEKALKDKVIINEDQVVDTPATQ
ncbi:hypothetical protein [Aestuariirhabdus sp. LZHN29]|uniref:hypothetical protein n=1 Tax=Aestuariirhabdus sp. LZHN29 TaxID=3417462 RepID=UPI003CF4E6C7